MKNAQGKFRYVDLADRIQHQIEKGAFKLSEKLPSLRSLCQSTGYSMTTVLQAYVELEKRGIVESRHRSGYFIRPRTKPLRRAPKMKRHTVMPRKINLDDLIYQLTLDMGDPRVLNLGGVAVAPDLLPYKRLYKHLKSIPEKQIPAAIAGYVDPQGHALLRHQITNLLFPIIPEVSMEDIVITNGCTEALSLSIKSVAKAGDTVILESPTDPWLRQTIRNYDIYALEIPADPETGIDLDTVARVIEREKIAACILNPNCQNPLGFVMPDGAKRTLLELLTAQGIPIIENDVCGDLYFGARRPNPIKKWDVDGSVLYCASFSKVLAAGLRVGWVVAGPHKERIVQMKLNRSMVSSTLNQAVIANYLKEGTYHRHLRKLREILKQQYKYCAAALHQYMPTSVRMTAPQGGLAIWVELPEGIRGSEVYAEARKSGIAILPGSFCASHDHFDRFIRIGYGGVWGQTMEAAIQRIGAIIRQLGG
jgi:DNA-binding transcriptional MocR family regulator